MWSFTDIMRRTENEYGYAPDKVDIWYFQECSMNEVAMRYNKRNTENMGQEWIYNDINPCDTAIMIGASAAARINTNKQISMQNAIIAAIGNGPTSYILVNVHPPTSWSTETQFKDALEDIKS